LGGGSSQYRFFPYNFKWSVGLAISSHEKIEAKRYPLSTSFSPCHPSIAANDVAIFTAPFNEAFNILAKILD
jgi:hypothetical protein